MTAADLGFLFLDNLKGKQIEPGSVKLSTRVRYLRLILMVVFAVLIMRLVWLQVFQGEKNRVLSDENRILARLLQAPRGIISDRNGETLAQNVPVYKKVNQDCVGNGQGNCPEYIEISRDEALKLQAEGEGDKVVVRVGRSYLFGKETSQVVGFVNEADKEDLEQNPEYLLGDLVGRAGAEYEYEKLLHGRGGAELVEISADSQVVRQVARREPVSGTDIKLTIDIGLQTKAYELLHGKSGSVVVLKPQTGEVLALVSSPTFDANNVAVSLNREDQPFFDRAIGGVYPPGSVFKLVTASAGLEEGEIDGETEIEDTGEIRIGSYRYGNWYFDQYGRREGFLNVVSALSRSNDIFFYKVGELVGAVRLAEWAKFFGYGQKTGIDLPGEESGLVPSPLWKERQKGERWFLGNTYHFAIGQADLLATPLQVAQVTAVIASGKLCRPHVLDLKALDEAGKYQLKIDENYCRNIELKDTTFNLVREGMRQVCTSGGTAFPFFNFFIEKNGEKRPMEVACKTGTAQFGDPEDRTHAWFTIYAPFADPQVAAAVMLEKAGEGSYQAAPVAKELLSYYFEKVQ